MIEKILFALDKELSWIWLKTYDFEYKGILYYRKKAEHFNLTGMKSMSN